MKFGPITWREPLGRPECPYAERWILHLGPLGSIRLHRWFRSDDKRAKHDHPSDFITFVLKGSYTDLGSISKVCGVCGGDYYTPCACDYEHGERGIEWRNYDERMTPGTIRFRKAEHRHTVDVDPGGCWTLLYFFPERRQWGFWIPRKDNSGRQVGFKFKAAARYFRSQGHHPCDQP